MTSRLPAVLVLAALIAGGAGLWYYQSSQVAPLAPEPHEVVDGEWLEHLHSQNPKVAEEAARQVTDMGASAVPEIQEVLRDPAADVATKKAAMKASGLLGPLAEPAVPDVAEHLTDPQFTEEAAVALSFMGRDAFAPLRKAASSTDPVVRREALRSIGKLKERAPLDARAVVPLLLEGLLDVDPSVRTVSATYLGIIHEEPITVVPALVEALKDEEPAVRSAAAAALGSFSPEAAQSALPALRKAAGDRNEDVAREAGVALVKLQSNERK
ncbi:MAG TPA: HEAT repeat domain-containing protein [Vicinamibacterales bacterium]|nr:HEAT repeat domain-containing protein [Vicinamibacterales bacterium]